MDSGILPVCAFARVLVGLFQGIFASQDFSGLGPFFWFRTQCNTRFEKAFGSKDRIFRVNLQDLMIICLFASLFLSPHYITPIFPYPIQVWGVFYKP